jgi:hypothetical protein
MAASIPERVEHDDPSFATRERKFPLAVMVSHWDADADRRKATAERGAMVQRLR